MFQFSPLASSRLCIQRGMTTHDGRRVSPFGHLRINAYVRLPEAYRSLSRPSSPVRAKASTVRPCSLDRIDTLPRGYEGGLSRSTEPTQHTYWCSLLVSLVPRRITAHHPFGQHATIPRGTPNPQPSLSIQPVSRECIYGRSTCESLSTTPKGGLLAAPERR
jgi:hypothetical protein